MMPYGIKPASAIFQTHIEHALKICDMFVVRTDDILVSSSNDLDRLENLSKILTVLCDLGVTLKQGKWKFLMDEVENCVMESE